MKNMENNINLLEYDVININTINKNVIENTFFDVKTDNYVMTTKGPKKITRLFIKGDSKVFDIRLSDGSTEVISETHRFRDLFGKWIYAPEIKVGSLLYNTKDVENPLEVVSINERNDFTVDLEVEDEHEYISENGLINHNTISFIAESSGGIEPVFALSYSRKIEKDKDSNNNLVYETVYMSDPVFDAWLNKNKTKEEKNKILEYVSKNKGSCQGAPFMTKEEESLFLTAGDLTSEEHLNSLEPWAVSTSLSVSKTINLPENCSKEEVADAYIKAYKKGIIGVSVYRDGSRGGVLVHNDDEQTLKITKNNAPKRPKELKATVHRLVVNKQLYYVVIGKMNDDVYEIFTGLNSLMNQDGEIETYIPKNVVDGKIVKHGKGSYEFVDRDSGAKYPLIGEHNDTNADALSRSISTSLRHGVDVSIVVDQLEKTKGALNSFAKAMARTLKIYIKDGTEVKGEVCPECGSKMIRAEGCKKCSSPSCGYSKCA